MLKSILLLVFGVVFVHAQGEHGCAAPMHFQAAANMHDHETSFYRSGFFSYDAIEEKVSFIEEIQENATRPQADELFLYREKKHYSLDLQTRTCKVTDLTTPFRPIAVREDSRFFGEAVIGSVDFAGAGVRVVIWGHHLEDTEAYGNETMTFTREECIPFSLSFYGMSKTSNQEYHYHRTFVDVTLGINDPNIFDVPKECMK